MKRPTEGQIPHKFNEGSVVSQYWSHFEKLSMELIRSQLAITPDVIYVTQASKDGGFDGEIVHHLALTENLAVNHRTLLEAKLRSGRESVGLRAFAATMIIAFNTAAQTLVIVCNKAFSEQALQQAALFQWKTNVQVVLVDGETLARWISINCAQLNDRFPRELLDFLLEGTNCSTAKLRSITISPFDQALSNSTKHSALEHDPLAFSASIDLGWKPSGEMATCRICIKGPQPRENGTTSREEESIIGHKRQKVAIELCNALRSTPGIAILQGLAGVGKSTLLKNIAKSLRDDLIPITRIDVAHTSSSRQLFLCTFSAITGIDLDTIRADHLSDEVLRSLFSTAGGGPVSSEITEAIIATLTSSIEDYKSLRDLNTHLLLRFLQGAVQPHIANRRSVIYFDNLNRSSTEVLSFIGALARTLAEAGFGVVIELREGGDAPLLSHQEWEAFTALYKKTSTLGNFEIEPLSSEEALIYLEELLPGLGYERYEVIRKRIGNIPLFLKSAANWLKQHRIVRGLSGSLLVEDLELFFEGIRPADCIAIIDRLILSARERVDYPVASCITAAVLLGGRLPYRALEYLCPEDKLFSLVERLCESGLFHLGTTGPADLVVAHDLLLERMQGVETRFPFRRAQVAERFLPIFDSLVGNLTARSALKVDLLMAVGNWPEAYPAAMEAGQIFEGIRQWAESSRYFLLAQDAAQYLPSNDRHISIIRALIRALEVEQERYRSGLEENVRRLDGLRTAMSLAPELNFLVDGDELRLRALLLEWRADFVREHFKSAYAAASAARHIALKNKNDIHVEYRGVALASYGITLKALDRRESSLRHFDKSVNAVPGSLILYAERLSNIAAMHLQAEPSKALTCYIAILHATKDKNYSILRLTHLYVDLSMAYFLLHDYQSAKENAGVALSTAEANNIPAQEARARNILGCCHWAAGDIVDADRQFDLAALAAERTLSMRFLWRMRTNRACISAELGARETAIAHARSAEDLIIEPRERNFRRLRKDARYANTRWYVALLALAQCYFTLGCNHDLERLVTRVKLPLFQESITAMKSGGDLLESLTGTPHVHNSKIMITG